MLNSAIHEFDSIRWLLGEEARKIYVTGVHTNSDKVSDLLDLITVHVSLSGDCVANFDVYMFIEITSTILRQWKVAGLSVSNKLISLKFKHGFIPSSRGNEPARQRWTDICLYNRPYMGSNL